MFHFCNNARAIHHPQVFTISIPHQMCNTRSHSGLYANEPTGMIGNRDVAEVNIYNQRMTLNFLVAARKHKICDNFSVHGATAYIVPQHPLHTKIPMIPFLFKVLQGMNSIGALNIYVRLQLTTVLLKLLQHVLPW